MDKPTEQYQTIDKYSRKLGGLQHVALFTKPSTIQTVESLTGAAETYVLKTARYEEDGGDYLFIERMDESGVTRIYLPPKATDIVARHRESLTKRRRSDAGKRRAAEMKRLGIQPGFMKNKKKA
jgi:hypothetical protein